MLSSVTVKLLLNINRMPLRAALISACLNPKDIDKQFWDMYVPDLVENGNYFQPIPFSMVQSQFCEASRTLSWKEAEKALGLPMLHVSYPEDVRIDETYELDMLPLTSNFIDGVLYDNSSNYSITSSNIQPGFVCSIYDQKYIVVDTAGMGSTAQQLTAILAIPAVLVDITK